jgi:hypothetical protein
LTRKIEIATSVLEADESGHVDYFRHEMRVSNTSKINPAGHWWLTSVILVTQVAEIRRISVQSQYRQIVQ